MTDGILRIRVAARPIDGAANEALRRVVAGALGVAPGRVALVSGATARLKVVEVDGLDADAVTARWPGVDV